MSAQLSPIQTEIDFDRNGKQISYLSAPHSRNSSAWGRLLIPIMVIKNGAGPTALLVGGSHGGEYEGPVCLLKLGQELPAEDVQGTVIILPALNLPAVLAGQRLSPIDHKDMNRVFPGRWNGTMTQVIAHYVHELILPRCDVVVDLHSGGYSLDLSPYISMHYLADAAQMASTKAALHAFQAPIGLIMEEFTGEGLLDYAVERMGKVFLCAELGGAGRLSIEALRIAELGVRNVLRHLGIMAGEVVTRESLGLPPMQLMAVPDAENYHLTFVDGIYETFFDLGTWITAGDIIGQVHYVEHPLRQPEPIVAQRSGVLIGTRGPGLVARGDCVALVAQPLSAKESQA